MAEQDARDHPGRQAPPGTPPPERAQEQGGCLTVSAGPSSACVGNPGTSAAGRGRSVLSASGGRSTGALSRPLSSLKSLSKKPASLGLAGAAAPAADGGCSGPGLAGRPSAWAGVCPGVLSGPGLGAAANGSAMGSLGPLFPGALSELTSSRTDPLDESVAWSPVRPGTGRESVKKKRDLAAGARGLASFPRLSPLASAAAPVSIVSGEEAATVSSRTPAPRSTVKANMNSGHSPQRGQRGARTDSRPFTHRGGETGRGPARPWPLRGAEVSCPGIFRPRRGEEARRKGPTRGRVGDADRLLLPPRDPGRGRSSRCHLGGRPAVTGLGEKSAASASCLGRENSLLGPPRAPQHPSRCPEHPE